MSTVSYAGGGGGGGGGTIILIHIHIVPPGNGHEQIHLLATRSVFWEAFSSCLRCAVRQAFSCVKIKVSMIKACVLDMHMDNVATLVTKVM